MSFAVLMWIAGGIGVTISATKDRKKTKQAWKKTIKMFWSMLPMMGTIIIIIGLTFAIIPTSTIRSVLGGFTVKAVILSGLLGSISLIPMFIATPLAGSLLEQGAGVLAIAMFMTTLNLVGFLTAPFEKEFFGWKLTIWRNALGLVSALVIALLMGQILS